jgi:enoyl-CoA hydratase/carnithine racemase
MSSPTHARVLTLDVAEGGGRIHRRLISDWSHALEAAETAVAIVIRSSAPAFCEGLDLDDLAGQSEPGDDAGIASFAVLLDRLEQDPRPVIAVVDGAAKGGGVGLAAVADLTIASERASFALPEALIGLIPAVVFPFIARRVGVARARWLALGGPTLDAPRAASWGLVDEIATDLDSLLTRQLARLSRMDPRSLAHVKRLVAGHYAAPERYRSQATDVFASLLGSRATRQRIARLRDGLSPWGDDDDG